MRFLSVCSGIEAASVAWNPLGWHAAAFSEIEPFPCAVLAHHYPTTPNHGDMTKFAEWPDHAIDLLCGGTPCQSFSVAGLRKGLDDPRGNLMLTFGAIAAKYRPRWLVWENVPGVLSSNGGRDFGAFLGMLGQLGYGFAYRVLDAQYFGVAQRRRRVFVVGCLGDWRSAAAVLFERHSLSGHPAPSREARQIAPTIPSRSTAGGGLGTDFDCDGGLVSAPELAACLTRGTGLRYDTDTDTILPVAFDTTQITSKANYSNPQPSDPCHPLAAGAHAPAIAFPANLSGTQHASTENLAPAMGAKNPTAVALAVALRGREGGATAELGDEVQNCLRASSGGGDKPHVLAPVIGWDNDLNASVEQMGTLLKGGDGGRHEGVAYTTKLHNTASNNAGKIFEERTTALDANSPPPALLTAMQVRRLTPTECERLQGFPDGWTAIPWRGKAADECPDGPRYKALGNSWAVPNVRWIGERIAAVDAIAHERQIYGRAAA